VYGKFRPVAAGQVSTKLPFADLLVYLVGASQQFAGDFDAERVRRLAVDHKVIPRGLLERYIAGTRGYLLFASLAIFLSAITRVKQSGQANRTPPVRERDKGRIVAASTRRLHSGHLLIFEGSLPIK
jgi:hypothetical protein